MRIMNSSNFPLKRIIAEAKSELKNVTLQDTELNSDYIFMENYQSYTKDNEDSQNDYIEMRNIRINRRLNTL